MLEADLHIHTSRYSGCSNIAPTDALRTAARVGPDVIAPTALSRKPANETMVAVGISGIGCGDAHGLHDIGRCRTQPS